MTNPTLFTQRQMRFLEAIHDKLAQIDDPDPDIITHESYRYSLRYVTRYKRKLPKLTFTPYGKDTKTKAEIMRNAGMGISDQWQQELNNLREKHGLKKAQDKQDRILARKFNSYWNRYWHPIARAIELLQDPQERFAKPNSNETVAEPIRLMMQDKVPETPTTQSHDKTPDTKDQDTRRYDEELMEVG